MRVSVKTPKELKELERRLREEPDNLGLRVTVASALREAGRAREAVELYYSVAIAYRDQGRALQAIAVCKSILAIAPDDARCLALHASLVEVPAPEPLPPINLTHKRAPLPSDPPGPPRRPEVLIPRISSDSIDETPLPGALPYHVADPTSSIRRSSEGDVTTPVLRAPSSTDLDDPTGEVPVATIPMERVEPEPEALPVRPSVTTLRDADTDELTQPHAPFDPTALRPRSIDPLVTSFFSHLPVERRAAALSRFHRRVVKPGVVVIARGAAGHPFLIVLRGELEIRRDHGAPYSVGPGEYAGEASLLGRVASTMTVVATADSQLLVLPPADFYDIVGAFPALWAELKDLVAGRG